MSEEPSDVTLSLTRPDIRPLHLPLHDSQWLGSRGGGIPTIHPRFWPDYDILSDLRPHALGRISRTNLYSYLCWIY